MPDFDTVDKITSLLDKHPVIAWTLLIALLLSAFLVMYKTYGDGRSTFHVLKEKKLAHLLTYIDAGIYSKPAFSIEQVFNQHYGELIGFEVISHLLSFPNPSLVIRDYLWAQRRLHYDEKKQEIQILRSNYFWIGKTGYFFLFLASILSLFISAIFTFVSVIKSAQMLYVGVGIEVLTISIFFIYVALINNREIHSAERILKANERRRLINQQHQNPPDNSIF